MAAAPFDKGLNFIVAGSVGQPRLSYITLNYRRDSAKHQMTRRSLSQLLEDAFISAGWPLAPITKAMRYAVSQAKLQKCPKSGPD